MTVTLSEPAPIASTLGPGDFRQRLAWITELNRDALRAQRREGLRLELTYAPAAFDRVREMVAREQDCCAFLTFDLQQEADTVRLVIEAPEHARDALDAVFEPFQAHESAVSVCGCSSAGCCDPQR
jgi:hypothetical protein